MKKKGFTIVELLGVIVILGLLAAFTIPALTKTLRESSEKEYDNYVKNISLAAENYFHGETDGNLDQKVFINVGMLVEKGYLKREKNPRTKKETADTDTIIISKNEDGTEKYEFVAYNATEKGYVSDGLLLHYDGYTAPVNNKWPDLSGNGNDGEIKNYNSNSILSNGLSLIDNDYIVSNNPVKTDSTFSIQIVFMPINPNAWSDVVSFYVSGQIDSADTVANRLEKGNNLNYYWYCKSDSVRLIEENTYFGCFENSKVNSFTLSAGSDQIVFYKNLNQNLVNHSTGNSTNSDIIVFFKRGNSNVGSNYFGNIYSVRVYDHALSKDEVKQNYNVDKVRFDIED